MNQRLVLEFTVCPNGITNVFTAYFAFRAYFAYTLYSAIGMGKRPFVVNKKKTTQETNKLETSVELSFPDIFLKYVFKCLTSNNLAVFISLGLALTVLFPAI